MELIAAVFGAMLGALIAGGMAFAQQRWSHDREAQARVEADRRGLVRELMRQRMDQPALVKPLNEIPLLFGDDEDALRL